MGSAAGARRREREGVVRSDVRAYLPRLQAQWIATEPERRTRRIPGTLVFADVSGFTPLTERLSRQGRVGAERLTDILNEVFGELLRTAFSFGGDLLKFGGDALLLLFTDAGHELRGSAAAASMQDALRPYRRLRTESGTVSLRMSVGAASGAIDALLVGTSHRELLVVGPVVSETARLEAEADAGEVLLSQATVRQLPTAALGATKAGGVLLKQRPVDATETPFDLPDAAADGSLGIPEALRAHLGGAVQDGEHRLATLSFIQFKGSDDLLASDGIDEVATELHGLVTAAQQACRDHGVTFLATDLDSNGGKILFAAGAPVATADDEDRLLLALRDVVATPSRLAVRAGANRGHAFAVDMGVEERRTYAVMGDATNLAARVMGKAPTGTVLATRAVLDRVRTRFELEPVEPFMVKGKSAPVDAAIVGEPRGRAMTARAAPLVGRDAELARLTHALGRARRGDGNAVEIVGDPGIGKSRLVAELVAAAGRDQTIEVNAGVYARNSPYFALRAPFRKLFAVPSTATDGDVEAIVCETIAAQSTELARWAPLLDVVLGIEMAATPEIDALDERFRGVRLRAVLAAVLDTLVTGSALITVEDAHWLDDATAGFLGFVLNTIEERPWLLVSTRRDADGGLVLAADAGHEAIELHGIDDDAAARLVATIAEAADADVPPHVVQTIVARGGGSPLLLEELAKSTIEGRDPSELPDTVEGALAARIDVLAPEDRDVLRQCAVLGFRVSRQHLAAMTGHYGPDLDAVLGRLGGFLERNADDDLEFRQSILREVAYGGLPYRRRRDLHGRAAVVVESSVDDVEEWADLLSLHCSEAHLHDKAWRYARIAASRARHNAAPLDAASFYERALLSARSLHVDSGELADTWEQLGGVAELGGRYADAAHAYAEARRLHRDQPLDLARLCGREGRLRERSGRSREALAWFTRGRRLLDERQVTGDAADVMRAELLLRYGGTRLRQGRPAASIPLLEEVVLRASTLDALPTLAHAYYLLDWAHSDLGHAEAEEFRALALPIYERLGDHAGQANVLNNLGVDAYYEGRWDDALALYERSRDARARAGDLVEMGTAANNVGEILSDQGHLERAAALFREALSIWRPSAFHVGIGLATSNLGRAAARAGDFDSAGELLDRAVSTLDHVGADFLALEGRCRQVERLVLMGDADALDAADDVVHRLAKIGGHTVLVAMVERLAGLALAQPGDTTNALDRLRGALDVARGCGAPFEVALTLEAIALVDPFDVEARTEAAAILRQLGVVATPAVPMP